jgi:hypothetical protein
LFGRIIQPPAREESKFFPETAARQKEKKTRPNQPDVMDKLCGSPAYGFFFLFFNIKLKKKKTHCINFKITLTLHRQIICTGFNKKKIINSFFGVKDLGVS